MCAFLFEKLQCFYSFPDSFEMASAEKREKWRLASQRWREHERLRVAEMRERNGPLTEEQCLERNEASRLGMQDLRERRAQPQAHAHGHATRGNVSTLMNN